MTHPWSADFDPRSTGSGDHRSIVGTASASVLAKSFIDSSKDRFAVMGGIAVRAKNGIATTSLTAREGRENVIATP